MDAARPVLWPKFTRFRGDTKRLRFTLTDDQGGIVQPNACTLFFNIDNTDGSPAIQKSSLTGGFTTVDNAAGIIEVEMVPADDAALQNAVAYAGVVVAVVTATEDRHRLRFTLTLIDGLVDEPALTIPTNVINPDSPYLSAEQIEANRAAAEQAAIDAAAARDATQSAQAQADAASASAEDAETARAAAEAARDTALAAQAAAEAARDDALAAQTAAESARDDSQSAKAAAETAQSAAETAQAAAEAAQDAALAAQAAAETAQTAAADSQSAAAASAAAALASQSATAASEAAVAASAAAAATYATAAGDSAAAAEAAVADALAAADQSLTDLVASELTEAVNASGGRSFRLLLDVASTAIVLDATGAADTYIRVTLFLQQDATGGRLITWPENLSWGLSSPPSISISPDTYTVFDLLTLDGGMTWLGSKVYTQPGAGNTDLTIVDDFGRADGSLGTSLISVPWIVTPTGSFVIASSKAKTVASTGNSHALVDVGLSGGYILSATVVSATTVNRTSVGLVFRCIDINNYLLLLIVSSGADAGGALKLFKRDASSYTQLIGATSAFGAGISMDLEITVAGGAILVRRSGANVLTYGMTSAEQTKYGAATIVGLRADSSGSTDDGTTTFDNLTVRGI